MPRGVTTLERPRGGRSFRVAIRHKGKDYPLGLYERLWDAALAYNIASEAIGRGARPPNEIPLDHRPSAETVVEIASKVRSRLGIADSPSHRQATPPSDSTLAALFEITIVGFWRNQVIEEGSAGISKAADRILGACDTLFWDRHRSFRQELLCGMVARRLNACFRNSEVSRCVLEDDGDDLGQLSWWLAVPDHLVGSRGFREEVEYRYPTLFEGESAVSLYWADLLGVTSPYSIDQVKRAYRSRSRLAHPDGGGSDEAFVRLHHAYREALAYLGRGRRSSPR